MDFPFEFAPAARDFPFEFAPAARDFPFEILPTATELGKIPEKLSRSSVPPPNGHLPPRPLEQIHVRTMHHYALAARRAESGILVSACRSSSFVVVPLPFFLQIIPITVSFCWLESVQT